MSHEAAAYYLRLRWPLMLLACFIALAWRYV